MISSFATGGFRKILKILIEKASQIAPNFPTSRLIERMIGRSCWQRTIPGPSNYPFKKSNNETELPNHGLTTWVICQVADCRSEHLLDLSSHAAVLMVQFFSSKRNLHVPQQKPQGVPGWPSVLIRLEMEKITSPKLLLWKVLEYLVNQCWHSQQTCYSVFCVAKSRYTTNTEIYIIHFDVNTEKIHVRHICWHWPCEAPKCR